MKFVSKIGGILSSVRFWILTLTAVISILNGQDSVSVVQVWLGAVVALGTLDSVAKNIAGTKK